jgi:hypothetical protein
MLSTAGPTPSKNVGPQGIGNVCWKWQLAWATRFNCGDAKTTVRPVNVSRFQIDCFPGAQTELEQAVYNGAIPKCPRIVHGERCEQLAAFLFGKNRRADGLAVI